MQQVDLDTMLIWKSWSWSQRVSATDRYRYLSFSLCANDWLFFIKIFRRQIFFLQMVVAFQLMFLSRYHFSAGLLATGSEDRFVKVMNLGDEDSNLAMCVSFLLLIDYYQLFHFGNWSRVLKSLFIFSKTAVEGRNGYAWNNRSWIVVIFSLFSEWRYFGHLIPTFFSNISDTNLRTKTTCVD